MAPVSAGSPLSSEARLVGLLLGTAVGDAVGLPAEGLSRRTIAALGWSPWRHRLLPGRGMVSDDTEHTLFVAQALLAAEGDIDRFERSLAWKLRLWLLALPAGVGLATGRAIIKLWLGIPPRWSGVRSAGNGPAMRSAVIGALFADDEERMARWAHRSTRLTHTDPRADTGALAIAMGAAFAMQGGGPDDFPSLLSRLRGLAEADGEWSEALDAVEEGLAEQRSVADFAVALGLGEGVGGYIHHTVPVALYAWLRHYGDFETTLTAVLDLGGDTDTVGAITGALAGATAGADAIPTPWLDGIAEWPRSVALLRRVAGELNARLEGRGGRPVGYFWPAVPVRNLLFLAVVLLHGFARLIPAPLRRRLSRAA